ncbi:MAG TPA: hypothetical protein VNT75_01520 [Symbiobacteriaceae bacterium]|nr:hypothetical protein [Symbiobacteriaceae bacterium]
MRLSELGPGACEAAFRAWRAGSGALLPYVKSTPFVSLSRFPVDMDLRPCDAVAVDVAVDAGELVILDFPGARSVMAGLRLWESHGLWPVVTFPLWFHPHGIVGDAALAFALLLQAPSAGPSSGWSLLLDSTRYSDDPLTPDRFNNQYELTEDDLPTVEELRELGVTGVLMVTDGPAKDDLQRYAAYLSQGQVSVRWHA